jgi:hypothetical protein
MIVRQSLGPAEPAASAVVAEDEPAATVSPERFKQSASLKTRRDDARPVTSGIRSADAGDYRVLECGVGRTISCKRISI